MYSSARHHPYKGLVVIQVPTSVSKMWSRGLHTIRNVQVTPHAFSMGRNLKRCELSADVFKPQLESDIKQHRKYYNNSGTSEPLKKDHFSEWP